MASHFVNGQPITTDMLSQLVQKVTVPLTEEELASRRYNLDIKTKKVLLPLKEITDSLSVGEPVYIYIDRSGHRHFGSVTKLLSVKVNKNYWNNIDFICGFDDRDNQVNLSSYDGKLITDWNNGTYYQYRHGKSKSTVTPVDLLGQELEVDDTVIYVRHKSVRDREMKIGLVTKTNKHGHIWCKNIKSYSNDYEHETKIKYQHDIIKIQPNMENLILLLKLKM